MIDWKRVAELRDEIGEDSLHEVVELFLDEVESVLMRLGGEGQLAADLHFLKGSAANLGFEAFCLLCMEGEATASRTGSASVDIGNLIATYAASKRHFLEELAKSHHTARTA